ncbi:carbohydrate sulfotransferase 15-like [Lineus longissimus]|uniref:carbohydrate sulfotransferase 15-like n=1 Tax=Lineus longissimus TaxID=88925 RepID=UPI002B4E0D83
MRFLPYISLAASLCCLVAAPAPAGEREVIGKATPKRVVKPTKPLLGKLNSKTGAVGVGGVKAAGKAAIKKPGKKPKVLNEEPVDKTRILDDLEQYEPPLKAHVDLLDHRKTKKDLPLLEDYKNPCWWQMGKFLCLPYFYIIGFRKCATTDLFARLNMHPHVVQPWRKETYWISYRKKRLPPSDFADLYGTTIFSKAANNPDKIIMGDGDPNVAWFFLDSPPKSIVLPAYLIHRYTPAARMIVMMRQPASRLYSDYLYLQHPDRSPQHFHENALATMERYTECFKEDTVRNCVYNRKLFQLDNKSMIHLSHSMYSIYVAEWLKVFPREQFLFTRTEDFGVKMGEELKKTFKFLDLHAFEENEMGILTNMSKANQNAKSDVGKIMPETEAALNEFFQPFNEALADITGDKKFYWDDLEPRE